jgi:hypothetical protein
VRRLSQRPSVNLGVPVHALVVGSDGQLFAGTVKGVFRSNDSQGGNLIQRIWRRLSGGLLGDLSRSWQPVNAGLTSPDIRALAIGSNAELLAGTQDGMIFRMNPAGNNWEKLGSGPVLKSVRSVTATTDGNLAMGVPADAPVDSAWPYFQAKTGQIDFDKLYPGIVPESWVVLQSTPPACTPYLVRTVAVADSADPSQPGKYTRVEVQPLDGLSAFDRITTAVLVQSQALALYAEVPIEKSILKLDHFVQGLAPGNKLIVSGKRMRVRLVALAIPAKQLVSDDGFRSAPLAPGDQYQVVRVADTAQPEVKQWHLQDKTGFVGSILLLVDTVRLEPAAETDETVGELVVISAVIDGPSSTTIELQTPLDNFYDRSTVTIYGNVVEATHGQTVANERLGTSETMKTSQRFRLKQQPLTFTPAPTATGALSSLSVQINGIEWDEVPFLYGQPLNRRAYIIRRSAQGTTSVIFGDGKASAGIPSGTEQITATYRIGLGRAGNVPAGRLNVLQGAVAGGRGAVGDIKAVTNPVAASGGSDPETMDQARWRAPVPLRNLQRIVSLTDYEDFARTFAGISKAKVSKIETGGATLLHLTVAGPDGDLVPKNSGTYVALMEAIEANRATPTPPVQMDSFEPVYFNVNADLVLEPDQRGRADDILAQAETTLRTVFGFEQREFGQPVAASEIIAQLQLLPGVLAVELVSFHARGDDATLQAALEAKLARPASGGLLPAQMLLINLTPGEGICLRTVL